MSPKSYERIKNYTTTISIEKTIAEIEKILTKFGATKIIKEYDDEGNPELLAFMIMTEKGEVPIKLPINVHKVLQIFANEVATRKLARKYKGDKAQAYRVGWRVIKDWLDAQLTLIKIDMVKVEEIFLSYIYDPASNKTMFQFLEDKKFKFTQIEFKG